MRVIIIGAGVAGLYAARLLKNLKVDYVLLEASDRIGGRIYPNEDLLTLPVDFGAEYIHGERSILKDLVDRLPYAQLKETFSIKEEKKVAFIRKEEIVSYTAPNENLQNLIELTNKIEEIEPTDAENTSVEEYLQKQSVQTEFYGCVEALYARTYGASSFRDLGLKECSREDRLWEYGEKNYRIVGSNKKLLDALKADLAVQTCNVVQTIRYDESSVQVFCENGKIYDGDCVVLTVPITCYQHRWIDFVPNLPEYKWDSFDKIGIEGGAKIICEFSKRFWPSHIDIYICDNPLIGQVWFNGPYPPRRAGGQPTYIAVAFVMGNDQANLLEKMNPKEAANEFVNYLDRVFGNSTATNPASKYFVQGTKFEWQKVPHIMGAYSYPKVGSGLDSRSLAAEPVDGRVFFAGEAFNIRSCATIHSAMESSLQAVTQIASFYGHELLKPKL